jgi:translocator protein
VSRLARSGSESTDILRQVLTVLAVLVTLTVNVLANALPINGQTTAAVSDSFPVLFVPAGYVFSIWGLIYLGLIAFTVYQALPSQRTNEALRGIGWLFILSCVANSVWIFLWHYELFPLTVLVMLALLVLLIAIYLRLDIGRAQVSTLERWMVHVPFSIYLGWITVATIANITDLLYYLRWDGWGIAPDVWAITMLAAATAIAALMALTRADVAFLLVLVWAFTGIAVKQSATPSVAIAAGIAAGVVALLAVASIFLRLNRRTGKPHLRAA